jgi:hypothetical protein
VGAPPSCVTSSAVSSSCACSYSSLAWAAFCACLSCTRRSGGWSPLVAPTAIGEGIGLFGLFGIAMGMEALLLVSPRWLRDRRSDGWRTAHTHSLPDADSRATTRRALDGRYPRSAWLAAPASSASSASSASTPVTGLVAVREVSR